MNPWALSPASTVGRAPRLGREQLRDNDNSLVTLGAQGQGLVAQAREPLDALRTAYFEARELYLAHVPQMETALE